MILKDKAQYKAAASNAAAFLIVRNLILLSHLYFTVNKIKTILALHKTKALRNAFKKQILSKRTCTRLNSSCFGEIAIFITAENYMFT